MRQCVHVVEDDPVVRTMLSRLLQSGGYAVREYDSGRALLNQADDLDGCCILLDVNMPEPDGFAVQRALAEKAVAMPVIMMSGSGDLTLLAMKAGVADFMQKPFGRSELLALLDQLPAEATRA